MDAGHRITDEPHTLCLCVRPPYLLQATVLQCLTIGRRVVLDALNYTVGHKKRATLFSAITPTFLCQFLHFL